jgi:hypothetical protein
MQMPPNANIPYEWQIGSENGQLAIVVPSWGQSDKTSYLILMDKKTRELRCECKGFEMKGDCHHIRGLIWFTSGPRHKRKGMQPSSLDAWKSIKEDLMPRQKTVLRTLQEIGEASNKQISKLLGWPINTITPRVLELRNMGLVDFSREQVDLKTNRTEIVWRAV